MMDFFLSNCLTKTLQATLPDGWAQFHQRVLDEEMEEELVEKTIMLEASGMLLLLLLLLLLLFSKHKDI